MPDLRFIHASDLHLGRRFLSVPQEKDGNIRGRLMEARHNVLGKLADAARANHAHHILLAGDTFDTATPSAGIVRQTLSAMRDASDQHWWVLPGNHDALTLAEPLWAQVARDAPDNVTVLDSMAPVALQDGVWVLPCPVTHRNPGRDLTDALPSAHTPDGHLRVGLAHGGIVDFDEVGAHIPPDRDRSAGLDYLALGDWHGRRAVNARTHYPGTPEQDRFRHNRRGLCLSVFIPGRGAEPEVSEIETGEFLWTDVSFRVGPDSEMPETLAAHLPISGRRNVLARVGPQGWASLGQRLALQNAAAQMAPDFGMFALNMDGLQTLYDATDLDRIDRAGALRQAAEALKSDAEDASKSAEDRTIAAEALSRLFSVVIGSDR